MQLQGTILSITKYKDSTGQDCLGYEGPNGFIYTHKMLIRTPQGDYEGQIGSKAEQYPLAVGSPITVEVTQDQHGTKFKKINPQFARQQPRQQPQAQPQIQPQRQPAPQQPKQQAPQSNDQTVIICRQNAVKSVCMALANQDYKFSELSDLIIDNAEKVAYWTLTGKQPPEQAGQRGLGMDGLPAEAEADDIPFN